MRHLLMGLFCAGSLLASSAMAKGNDIIELGLGLRMLFNADVYTADNADVDLSTDTFPIAGDHAMGPLLGVALGHQFQSRKGPWACLLKYNYSFGAEEEVVNAANPFNRGFGAETSVKGTLSKHDVLLVFRLPSSLSPLPLLDHPNLFYDLGIGASTLSYDYELSSGYASKSARTGLAGSFGIGYRHELNEEWDLTAKLDFLFSEIQDIENSSGDLVHDSHDANAMHFQIGVARSFESLF